MTGFLLDTHIWFWYLIGSQRLSPKLRKVIDTAQRECWLSPISVWELAMLAVRGRIQIVGHTRDWVMKAKERFPINEAPLTTEVALTSQDVTLPHRDPADHFIAATALVYRLTLITVDHNLVQAKWLSTQSG